jgi:hypothetical protein
MFHTHLSSSNSPPAVPFEMEAVRPAFQWHCHLPLAQGSAIRAVTVPPGGVMQVLLRERHSRLILETDGLTPHRCETVAAELTYWQGLRHALRRLGLPQNERLTLVDDNLHVTGTPVSFPFLTAVLQGLIDRAEAARRMSEAAARTARSGVPAPSDPPPARTLSNVNLQRALTLFFYQAEKIQLARVELHQIDRTVEAPSGAIEPGLAAHVPAAHTAPVGEVLPDRQRLHRRGERHGFIKLAVASRMHRAKYRGGLS